MVCWAKKKAESWGNQKLKFKKPAFLVLIIGLVALVPLLITSNLGMQYVINMLLFAYFAAAWNIIGGYAGQLAIGNGVYVGIGAYVSTILFAFEDVSPWVGMLAGGIVAAILALLVGSLTFRLSGSYFALATIALLLITRLIFISNNYVFGYHTKGALGLSLPWYGESFINMQFESKSSYFYVMLGLLILCIAVSYWIKSSKSGYYLQAINTNPAAASSLGVNVKGMKLFASMVSAFLTAIGGTFYVQFLSVLDPDRVLGYDLSVQIILFAIIGGKGTLAGPVLAAMIMTPLQDVLRGIVGASVSGLAQVIYAVILMVFVYFLPNGLWPAITDGYQNLRNKANKNAQQARY
jgi:branched-chain amino acid transport system permease protein